MSKLNDSLNQFQDNHLSRLLAEILERLDFLYSHKAIQAMLLNLRIETHRVVPKLLYPHHHIILELLITLVLQVKFLQRSAAARIRRMLFLFKEKGQ